MIIGYVTAAEADDYISANYISTDSIRTNWEALSLDDKNILLQSSYNEIDSLVFPGRKTLASQTTQFPRYPSSEVPIHIKYAQIENAVSLSDTSHIEDAAFYERLRLNGVKSYSIGNVSESLYPTLGSKLTSIKAFRLVQPFMQGGYNIE